MEDDYLSVNKHEVEYKQLTERSSNIFALREQSIKPIINLLDIKVRVVSITGSPKVLPDAIKLTTSENYCR